MSYDRFPPGLKVETTFCLYKLEPGKDGKKKKVLYQAASYFNIGTKKMRRIAEDNLGNVAVFCGNYR